MVRFRQKPEAVDPRQFTGGEDNAKMLSLWLSPHGYRTQWVGETSVVGVTLPEQLQIIDTKTNEVREWIRIGEWIVRKDTDLRIFTDAEFKERFEQV